MTDRVPTDAQIDKPYRLLGRWINAVGRAANQVMGFTVGRGLSLDQTDGAMSIELVPEEIPNIRPIRLVVVDPNPGSASSSAPSYIMSCKLPEDVAPAGSDLANIRYYVAKMTRKEIDDLIAGSVTDYLKSRLNDYRFATDQEVLAIPLANGAGNSTQRYQLADGAWINVTYMFHPHRPTGFPVDVVKVGGSDGDESMPATWVYDVYAEDGQKILSSVSPQNKRPDRGPVKIGTDGYAHFEVSGISDVLTLGLINEVANRDPSTYPGIMDDNEGYNEAQGSEPEISAATVGGSGSQHDDGILKFLGASTTEQGNPQADHIPVLTFVEDEVDGAMAETGATRIIQWIDPDDIPFPTPPDNQGYNTVTTGATTLTKANNGTLEFITATPGTGETAVVFSQTNADPTANIGATVTLPTGSSYPSSVEITVVTDVRVDVSTFKLQIKTRDISVLATSAESAWTDVHTGEECS